MRHTLDHWGIRSLIFDPDVGAQVNVYAKEAAAVARAEAPRDSGDYAKSIRARRFASPYQHSVIASNDYKAWMLEFGTQHRHHRTRAFHTLENAARFVGMRISKLARTGPMR